MNPKKELSLKLALCLLSFILFCASIPQTAFYTGEKPNGEFSSVSCLIYGWLYLNETPSWLGNITLAISDLLLLIPRKLPGIISGSVTMILMLTFLLEKDVLVNESGRRAEVVSLGAGFILWTASAAVLFAGSLTIQFLKNKQTT